MDLALETQRLRLDLLAVQVSRELDRAGIPHALVKGPSTSTWLYDPPRVYNDVDMLVPFSRVEEVVSVLRSAGIAGAVDGRVGEAAAHSLMVLSTAGFQLDLHISLPTLPPAGDLIWEVLSPHVERLDLGVGSVPALDMPARCLVLALHALNPDAPQAGEDLRRAYSAAAQAVWRDAAQLAGRLDAEDLFEAGLEMIGIDSGRPMSARAYLYATAAPSAAFGLQRLREARRRDVPGMVWREIFPSARFMRHAYPLVTARRFGYVRAHLVRWSRLANQLPGTVRALRAARLAHRG